MKDLPRSNLQSPVPPSARCAVDGPETTVPSRADWPRLLAWLPIPLLLVTMAVLWAADLRTEYELPILVMTLNFVTRTLACLFIVYLAVRSFLVRGAPGVLFLGCGVTIWGASGFVASASLTMDANFGVAVSNVGLLLAAVCHLAGVILSNQSKRTVRAGGLWLATGYGLALGAVGLVVLATFEGWLPNFFVDGRGGTLVRYVVLGSALAMFLLTAILLWEGNRPSLSWFTYWYVLALLLIAVGVFGMLIQSSRASWLNWACRTTQYLSGIYMFIAALMLRRESGGHAGIMLTQVRKETRYRYGVAIAIVLAAAGLRMAFLPILGTRATFSTFYPAVIFAALYGGLRAGLLATAFSALLANYLWMEPIGQFGLRDPGDWASMAIFLVSGTMICWITEALHRSQKRTTAAEAEAAIAAERVRVAESQRRTEADLAEAQRVAQVGSWHWDAKTDVTTGSDELLRIYGLDPTTQAMPDFREQRVSVAAKRGASFAGPGGQAVRG